jgi:hypothetical protein
MPALAWVSALASAAASPAVATAKGPPPMWLMPADWGAASVTAMLRWRHGRGMQGPCGMLQAEREREAGSYTCGVWGFLIVPPRNNANSTQLSLQLPPSHTKPRSPPERKRRCAPPSWPP